jgi:hypothetical protein
MQTVRSNSSHAPIILLYGTEGRGKTTLASKFPGSAWLLFEDGLPRVGIDKDKTGEYPDKNKVTRIIPLVVNAPPQEQKAIAPKAAPQGGNGAKGDAIPF